MFHACTFKAPAHWASALINGDRSGMTDEDEQELDAYLEAHPEHGMPVSCSDYPELEHWGSCFADAVLCETLEYSYLTHARFEYFINCDERGEFRADVRDEDGETVWETDGSVFEDGFMRHKDDLEGLRTYLQSLGIMAEGDTLTKG